jgi:hypothetical protein
MPLQEGSPVDKQEGAAAPPSSFKRAACGWGCFCDACWLAASTPASGSMEEEEIDRLIGAIVAVDVLRSLASDVFAGDALPGLEEAAERARLERAGGAAGA